MGRFELAGPMETYPNSDYWLTETVHPSDSQMVLCKIFYGAPHNCLAYISFGYPIRIGYEVFISLGDVDYAVQFPDVRQGQVFYASCIRRILMQGFPAVEEWCAEQLQANKV